MNTAYVTYRNEAPYPFCPGCSHSMVLDQLNAALVKLQVDPMKVVIVSDIGCSGLSDQYFNTNAFHGLHGRALTYATGLKLANPDLKVIAIMGDGGCGIGGHHLLNAARRNIGVTTLVLNNFNYGMTGGQHSVTTPHGGKTSTTQYGGIERPLDIAGTVALNGASFVVRTTAFDKELPSFITEAIQKDGFSLLDIWELCAAYYVPNNTFTRRALDSLFATLGYRTGIVHRDERKEYTRSYSEQRTLDKPTLKGRLLETKYSSTLNHPVRILIAGAAGQKVMSTAALLGTGAVLSGLNATRRDDYPVTVMTGHSISEIILSPNEVYYTGIDRPNIFIALAKEGMKTTRRQFEAMSKEDTFYVRRDLLPMSTPARTIPMDIERTSRKEVAVTAISAVLRHSNLYPLDAFREAIRIIQRPALAEDSLKAVDKSPILTG